MKIVNYLGLSYKAKSLILGTEQVLKAIRSKACYLVILSNNCSFNTLKLFTNKTNFYHIALITVSNEIIAKAIPHKSAIVLGIKNEGIARAILELKGADCCETKCQETFSIESQSNQT